jgi:hypothetical protein
MHEHEGERRDEHDHDGRLHRAMKKETAHPLR